MSSPLTSSQFVRLLDKRLRDVADGVYKDLPSMIDTIYNRQSTGDAWEEFYQVGAVPDIPTFNGKVDYLPVYPGYYTRIEPAEYAGGLMFERKLIDDKKYAVLEDQTGSLVAAALRTQEKIAVRPFAHAFSSAFDFMTSEEGVALCSDSHTTKSGVSTSSGFDNAGVTALSKTALAATRILMRNFRNDIGERIDMGHDFAIIVPDNLVDTAEEIIGTAYGYEPTTTSANKKNVAFKRYDVIPYARLDDHDTNNWYMVHKGMMAQNLLWLDRVKPETQMTVDFDTFIAKYSVYFRVANGFRDWRWIFGHQVS